MREMASTLAGKERDFFIVSLQTFETTCHYTGTGPYQPDAFQNLPDALMANRNLGNLAEVAAHLDHLDRHQLDRVPPHPRWEVGVGDEMLKKEEGPGRVVHHHPGHQVLPVGNEEGEPAGPGLEPQLPTLDQALVLAQPLLCATH